jgi:hypothetical protein
MKLRATASAGHRRDAAREERVTEGEQSARRRSRRARLGLSEGEPWRRELSVASGVRQQGGRHWRPSREEQRRSGRESRARRAWRQAPSMGGSRRESCWNLLSIARKPTRVNSDDNRVTC